MGSPATYPTRGYAHLGQAVDRRERAEHLGEHAAVVHVRPGEERGEGDALGVDHQVALRALLAAIRRIRPGRLAPLCGGTLVESTVESTAARLQSMRSASPIRFSSARSRRAHTPAACQSRSRRQHVLPEPQPISGGSSAQGQPVRSTNRMPASAARSSTRGRPLRAWDGASGSNGAIIAHSSSGAIRIAPACSCCGEILRGRSCNALSGRKECRSMSVRLPHAPQASRGSARPRHVVRPITAGRAQTVPERLAARHHVGGLGSAGRIGSRASSRTSAGSPMTSYR